MKLNIDWWKSTTKVLASRSKERRGWVWLRLLGLPLSMWYQKIFKQLGDQCGGFNETEEETSLKNNLY
ncbi:hypothetical protein H5410_042385 [Solanum commersonii]|uniref:DUF4283 domain-containing protein n=1 Tax=Solanum commersonii TaxID=4109 RepID=A0A9J5XW85_SOLCO|nr:hypothetical protein H5410_042385 [Solanum commersonii]